jgi:hypothetical protein
MMTSSPAFQLTGVGYPVGGRELERVDDTQHLVEVAARCHRVHEH